MKNYLSVFLFLLAFLAVNNSLLQKAYATGTIQGAIYIDANSDGTHGSGESAYLGGATVDLIQNGSVIASTTSSTTNGTYSFTGLTGSEGSYVVLALTPNGYVPTSQDPLVGSYTSNLNFGIVTPGSTIPAGTNDFFGDSVQIGSVVWVTDWENNQIVLYNTDGTATGTTYSGNGLSGPTGIAKVGSLVWVANVATGTNGNQGTVSRFKTDGTSAGPTISTGVNEEPLNVANIPQSGGGQQLWVSVQRTSGDPNAINGIERFNSDGTSAGSTINIGTSIPKGILAVNNGITTTVWVADSFNNKILLFNTDGTSAGSIIGNGLTGNPSGLSLSPSGTEVWVTENNTNAISVFGVDTSPLQILTGLGLNHPGLAANIANSTQKYVWVANVPLISTNYLSILQLLFQSS